MSNIFDIIQVKRPNYSRFDLSHEKKLSCNMGDLIPILLEEVVPGDSFKVSSEIMMRLAPMLAPIMHRVNVYTHYFYIPNRLVWDNFNDHITGGEDGLANPAYPTVTIDNVSKANFGKGSLADYLGLPLPEGTITDPTIVSAIPFRAYALCFNEYYRDQNLQNKINIDRGDGQTPNQFNITSLQKRAWEKDYFTSCLPSAQKGPSVALPIEGTITPQYRAATAVDDATGQPILSSATGLNATDGFGVIQTNALDTQIHNLETNLDLTSAGVDINELRKASRLQEWLELANRGGSRISEVIRNFFGVTPDDLRLSRPQYLGGGKQPIVISEVLNTAGTEEPATDPTHMQAVGEMAGHGISVGKTNKFQDKFKEHGYVMGIMSILPRTAYQQGIPRHWNKFDKFDTYWPQFAQLGEQEVLRKEIYNDYAAASQTENDVTFGYAPRYAEYKYAPSTVHGDFRKDAAGDNLSYWHMGRYFDTAPTLSGGFVQSDPTHRIFAVTDPTVHKLYVQIYNKVSAVRPMPYFNDPTL